MYRGRLTWPGQRDPGPNYTKDIGKGWAPRDAFLHVPAPGALAAEFAARHVGFFHALTDDGERSLGFTVQDAEGHVLYFGTPTGEVTGGQRALIVPSNSEPASRRPALVNVARDAMLSTPVRAAGTRPAR